MSLKANHLLDVESATEEKLMLELARLSTISGHENSIFSSIIKMARHISGHLKAAEFWIIEKEQDKNFLWNKNDEAIREEIKTTDKFWTYLTESGTKIIPGELFLEHKYQFIFKVTSSSKDVVVGFSMETDFDQSVLTEPTINFISARFNDLFYVRSLKNETSISRKNAEILGRLPQAVVFKAESGQTYFNKEGAKLFEISSGLIADNQTFELKLKALKNKVINKEEVELIGNNMLTSLGALPSSFGEDWIWKFEHRVLKAIKKSVKLNQEIGELWVFDNVSELYYANERLNTLFRTLNVAYDEINANLTEFQSKAHGSKSITDLEAEESRIIQQYDDKDILGKVTHDLRTPFAKVYTIVQLLLSDNQENLSEQQIERINLIKQIVADGLQIVKGFLATGNMVLDDKKYNPEIIKIQEFVNDNLVPYELLSAKKNIIFITDIPNETVTLKVDKTYLKRVIDNLISNAIKFSPFGSQINYSVIIDNGWLIFSIKDNGPGLTADDKSRLFKKYQQLSAKPIGTDESTGLGLYIVKSMVDKMGGKIGVESEAGKGADFKVSFPVHID